jgi:hypothetical protein
MLYKLSLTALGYNYSQFLVLVACISPSVSLLLPIIHRDKKDDADQEVILHLAKYFPSFYIFKEVLPLFIVLTFAPAQPTKCYFF